MATSMRRLAQRTTMCVHLTTRSTLRSYSTPIYAALSENARATLALYKTSVHGTRMPYPSSRLASTFHTQRAVACSVPSAAATVRAKVRSLSVSVTTTPSTTTTTLQQRVSDGRNRAGNSNRVLSSTSSSCGGARIGAAAGAIARGGQREGREGGPRILSRMVTDATNGMDQFQRGSAVFKRRGRSVRVNSNKNHGSGVSCSDDVKEEEEEKRDNALDKLFVNYRTYNASASSSESEAQLKIGEESDGAVEHPVVVIISGPSGVGKDAVVRLLQERRPDLKFVVTATTRPRREKEVDGVDYFFVSREDFQSMIEQGELLEYATVYGDYKGIPKQQVRDLLSQDQDVVLRLDVQGAATVRSILPDAVSIFITAESDEALIQRLVQRKTEDVEKLNLRVETARREFTRVAEFDYVVVNEEGQLSAAVNAISYIIDIEKRTKRTYTL